MKIKVLTDFVDKFNMSNTFHVGDEIEVDSERGENLVARGLAEKVGGNDEASKEESPDSDEAFDSEYVCKEVKKRRTRKSEE